jgi:hypothetical protein
MSTAQMQVVTRIGSFKKSVVLNDSTETMHLLAGAEALPGKKVIEIHFYIKHLKGL